MKDRTFRRILLGACLLLNAPTSFVCLASNEQHCTILNSFAQVRRSNARKKTSPDYRVWRILSPNTKGISIAFVSVNPRYFNREDMTALAMRLKKRFARIAKVRAILFDDPFLAKNFADGTFDLTGMEKLVRGTYYLDRAKPEEYIQFSSDKGKPSDEVTVELTCKN